MSRWRDIKDTYKIQDEFVNGSHGTCLKGYCKTLGCPRVLRHIPKSQTAQLQIARSEARLMLRMNHPNLLSLAEIVEDDMNLYLVMDFCEGGALSTHIQDGFCFPESQSLVLIRQVLSGVRYLHDEVRVCHRNLRLESLLLSSTEPVVTSKSVLKIIDF